MGRVEKGKPEGQGGWEEVRGGEGKAGSALGTWVTPEHPQLVRCERNRRSRSLPQGDSSVFTELKFYLFLR